MTTQLPPEGRPADPWRRFTSTAEANAALPPFELTNPASIGITFVQALDDPVGRRDVLDAIVTPESRPAWGDFTAAARMYAEVDDPGFGSVPNYAEGAPDVAYFKILRGTTESYQMLDDQPMLVPMVVTLVWRPEHGRWMVHAIGEPLAPEDVPRTARPA